MKREDLTEKLLDIKREKGWSWKHICEAIGGYSEVLIVGAILGQMKLTKPQAANAAELFGLSKSVPLSLAALCVTGFVDMISVNIRQTAVVMLTPPQLQGRVSAVEWVFIRPSNELGAFEAGALARVVGTGTAVVAGGGAKDGGGQPRTRLGLRTGSPGVERRGPGRRVSIESRVPAAHAPQPAGRDSADTQPC